MIEMILSHLCDQGLDFSDYPEALQHFFTYVARTNMREKIIFTDYYRASAVVAVSSSGTGHRPGECQEQRRQPLHGHSGGRYSRSSPCSRRRYRRGPSRTHEAGDDILLA